MSKEPHEEVDKYGVAIGNDKNIIDIYSKERKGKQAKTLFLFLESGQWNPYSVQMPRRE